MTNCVIPFKHFEDGTKYDLLFTNIHSLTISDVISNAKNKITESGNYDGDIVICLHVPTNQHGCKYVQILNNDQLFSEKYNYKYIGFHFKSLLNDSLEDCDICFASVNELETPYNCNHTICNMCYQTWQRNCPFCRAEMQSI